MSTTQRNCENINGAPYCKIGLGNIRYGSLVLQHDNVLIAVYCSTLLQEIKKYENQKSVSAKGMFLWNIPLEYHFFTKLANTFSITESFDTTIPSSNSNIASGSTPQYAIFQIKDDTIVCTLFKGRDVFYQGKTQRNKVIMINQFDLETGVFLGSQKRRVQ